MNLWRLAFVALVAAIGGLVVGVVAATARHEAEHEHEVVAPVEVSMQPVKPNRWTRIRASLVRFGKVFAFVALGLVVASLASPEGLRLLLEPLNVITMFVASTIGAILKYVQWSDVTAETPPTVTLALGAKPAAQPAAEGDAQ